MGLIDGRIVEHTDGKNLVDKINEMQYYFTPEMFGKTGTSDDTAVIQAMFDYIKANNYTFGAKVHFGAKTYNFNTVTVMTPQVTITSAGLLDGQFLVQSVEALNPSTFNILPMNVVFDGVKFKSASKKAFAINFIRLRDATVKGCYFENYGAAILSSSEQNFGWQRTARIKITDNVFKVCDYFVQTELASDVGDPQYIYYQHGDYIFEGNYFFQDTGGDTSLYLRGQDGAIIKGNYFFHGYSGTGRNIDIYESNYVVIEGNNFFEASKEAILIDRPRHMIIKGNNFALSGQKVISSAIEMKNSNTSVSEMNIIIDGNVIDGSSSHGIHLEGNIVNCKIMNNSISKIGQTKWKGTGSQNTNSYDIVVDSGDNLVYNAETVKYRNNVVLSGNSGEKGVVCPRGAVFNNYWLPYLDNGNFFGNMRYGNSFTGLVDLKSVVVSSATGVSNTPINPAFPCLLKSATGLVSNITNAGINQIVWFIAGSSGLNIENNSNIVTKTGANIGLLNGQTCVLMKSDAAWYQIA